MQPIKQRLTIIDFLIISKMNISKKNTERGSVSETMVVRTYYIPVAKELFR